MTEFSQGPTAMWPRLAREQAVLVSWGILAALAGYAVIAPSMAWTKADDLLYVLGIVAGLSLAASYVVGDVTVRWSALFAPLSIVAIVFAGYALVSTSWAPSPDITVGQAINLLIRALFKPVPNVPLLHALKVIALFTAAIVALVRLRESESRWFFDWFAGAVALGALLFLADFSLGYPMIDTMFGPPVEYRINANIEALSLLLWPALLALMARGRTIPAIALWIIMAFAVLSSPSQAAWLGFFTGSAALAVMWRWPRAGAWTVSVCAAAGVIAAPLLGSADAIVSHLPAWFVHEASVLERVSTWSRYALRIEEVPLFGHGFRSNYPSYPTNFAIQIWSELGAIGAVLTAAALGLFGLATRNRGRMCSPYLVAAGAAIYAQAYVTLGAWLLPALGIRLLPMVIALQLCSMIGRADRR